MLRPILVAAAVLLALGSPSFAQNATAPGMHTKSVDPALLREVRQMALEVDRAAAKPAPAKSDEAIAAETRAIEGHREGFFARVAERAQ